MLVPGRVIQQAQEFTESLYEWQQSLGEYSWKDIETQGPTAVFSVDMINGFAHEGALASPRIRAIIPEVVEVMKGAYAHGVRDFVLAQDAHQPNSVEFQDYPPHCLKDTAEAEMIPELANLPFAEHFLVSEKNSLNVFQDTLAGAWLDKHQHLKTVVVIGNCTDLCVLQTAMHLKLYANQLNLPMQVIVPENAVQTYDIPVEIARAAGILPHSGDTLHLLALYQMAMNGVKVVRKLV